MKVDANPLQIEGVHYIELDKYFVVEATKGSNMTMEIVFE